MQRRDFQNMSLFGLSREVKASTVANITCAVWEKNNTKTFSFLKCYFGMDDSPRPGRQADLDEDHLNGSAHDYPCQSRRELGITVDCDQSTILRHLHSMPKFNNWVGGCRTVLSKSANLHFATL
ncbi:ZHX3 [Trypoxylus dichotomus]